jgi:hypothetical protein
MQEASAASTPGDGSGSEALRQRLAQRQGKEAEYTALKM